MNIRTQWDTPRHQDKTLGFAHGCEEWPSLSRCPICIREGARKAAQEIKTAINQLFLLGVVRGPHPVKAAAEVLMREICDLNLPPPPPPKPQEIYCPWKVRLVNGVLLGAFPLQEHAEEFLRAHGCGHVYFEGDGGDQ